MKHIFRIVILTFMIAGFTGCSMDNSNPASDHNIKQTTEITTMITPTKALSLTATITSVPTQTPAPTTPSKELPDWTENSDIEEYQLCGLYLHATEEEIIQKLGDKYSREYDAYDGFAWAELRCHMMYDGITVTTNRSLVKSEYDVEGEDLLSEIDIYSPEYETAGGIKVGDSLDEVIAAYEMNGFYEFDEYTIRHNLICAMLSERVNLSGKYEKYNYEFDYGEFEKVAYIYWFDEERPNVRPSLIFLFYDDIVTHIILYNWLYEAV